MLNFKCPEAARLDCFKWYYVIIPPSDLPIADGSDCDWQNLYDKTDNETNGDS